MSTIPFYSRIWFKLTVPLSLLLAITLGASTLMSLQTSQDHFDHVLGVEFSNSRDFILSSLDRMEEAARLRVSYVHSDRELGDLLQHGDMAAAASRLRELAKLSGLDELLLLGEGNQILLRGSSGEVVEQARQLPCNPTGSASPSSCYDNGRLVLYVPSSLLAGAGGMYQLVAGSYLDLACLKGIKQHSHIDITLVKDGQIFLSTLAALAVLEPGTGVPPQLSELPQVAFGFRLGRLAGEDFYLSRMRLPHLVSGLDVEVLLSHSHRQVEEARWGLVRRFLVLSLIIAVVALLIITLYCSSILRPLAALGLTASAVGRGERARRLDVTSGDEFQLMAHHFNSMLDVLESQDQALRTYNESLEQRIQLRTLTLQEQNSFIKSVLSSSTMAIAATDLDYKILYFNPMAEEVFGYESREVLGRTVPELHERQGIDGSLFFNAVDKVKEDDIHNFSLEQERDGQLHFIEGSLSAVRDQRDEASGYLLLANDVTEWKMLEARLRSALAELNIIFENAAQAIVFIRDQLIAQVNSSFERLFAFSREQVIGRNRIDFWSGLFHGDYEHFWQSAYEQFSHGQVVRAEVQLRNSEDKLFWAGLTGKALQPDELSQGVIWIIEDVSEKRQARQLLQDATRVAEQANRAKSEFLANMSHEIRTPMNGILGMTALALDSCQEPQQQEYLQNIKFSADTLLQLINDILDLSKIEAGHMELEQAPFDLAASLQRVVDTAQVLATGKEVTVCLQLDSAVPRAVAGDSLRLSQVLLNLLSNAVKFTSQGQVTLLVEKVGEQQGQIELSFTVEDSGIGIGADKLDEIFHSFAQEDSSISRRYGGTGLGLSICQQLCQLMGGTIAVESRQGQGSRFSFQIPMAQVTEQESQNLEQAALEIVLVYCPGQTM